MGLSRAMIDAFVEAGGTVEQLAAMIKADLDEQEARKAQKRAGNAERQRRFKAKRREVTDDNAGNALPSVTPPPLPPKDIYSNPLSPPPVSSDEETTPPAKVAKIGEPKPEGVSEQVWADFLQSRKARRAPVTATVVAGISREAAKAGWTLEAALAESVARGWQSFKAEWVHGTPARPPDPGGNSLVQSILAKQAATA